MLHHDLAQCTIKAVSKFIYRAILFSTILNHIPYILGIKNQPKYEGHFKLNVTEQVVYASFHISLNFILVIQLKNNWWIMNKQELIENYIKQPAISNFLALSF